MQKFTEAAKYWQTQLEAEEEQLQKLEKIIQKELTHAPEGSLTISQKGGRTWYRHRVAGPSPRNTFINQENKDLIYRLAQKSYNVRLLRAIRQEQDQMALGKSLSFTNLGDIYDSYPEIWKPFIEPHVLPDHLYIKQWQKEQEASASGDSFKSKSEHLFDRIYRDLEAPHVYEPRLWLGGYGYVRPDFVVLNTRTRQTFYHEHFGMMDDPAYCAKALSKLQDYHRNGFYEGENLIITMESSLHPMDPGEMEDILRKHLK